MIINKKLKKQLQSFIYYFYTNIEDIQYVDNIFKVKYKLFDEPDDIEIHIIDNYVKLINKTSKYKIAQLQINKNNILNEYPNILFINYNGHKNIKTYLYKDKLYCGQSMDKDIKYAIANMNLKLLNKK